MKTSREIKFQLSFKTFYSVVETSFHEWLPVNSSEFQKKSHTGYQRHEDETRILPL